MTLCARCEILFQKCRPLLNSECPVPQAPEDLPDLKSESRPAGAVAANARNGDFLIQPIRVTDFYRGRP